MKTKVALFGLLVVVLNACTSPRYLPYSDEIGVNVYGSYIIVAPRKAPRVMGELIAIDSTQLVVLSEKTKKCVTVPASEVVQYALKYANAKDMAWAIPVYLLSTLSHGYYAAYTFPLNLFGTIGVAASSDSYYTYDKSTIPINQLSMFARFPQGIPANISLDSIK